MAESKRFKFIKSMQVKLIASFLLLILTLIALLNTYPLRATRDSVFSSKQSSMSAQAAVMSSSLSVLETLSAESVSQVIALLDSSLLSRVIVTDDCGRILYDTSEADSNVGRLALFSEIWLALEGKEVFYSRYTGSAFMSRASCPISSGGAISGAVYLYEYDEEQASLMYGMRRNLQRVSYGVCAIALFIIVVFTLIFSRRIMELVRAMRIVRDGKYDYRTTVKGGDELSELSEEFNNLTQRLEDTETVRRRFVSDASHELKTPLASIRLLSDSIVQNRDMDAETMRDFVVDIGSEAERLQRTTEKLLNLTRLDSTGSKNLPIPVDMRTVAERTLHLLSPLAEKRDVTLKYRLEEDCLILATEDDLYQIIFNLVENGIKYNTPGGRVLLTLRTEGESVLMTVEDTGVGIPPEALDNIFDRFYRVDKARSREAGGSGLGLSIVHDAVTLHGGTVRAESGEDGGSRFTVVFPLWRDKEGRI